VLAGAFLPAKTFTARHTSARPIECRKDSKSTWIWFRSQTSMFETLFPHADIKYDPLVNCILKHVKTSGKCFGWQFRFA
jgi:hypothetical protein